jgi:(2Fe-2S) ferredoxin
MGRNFATELSTMDTMPIEQQINLHLQYNFYPPIPSSMVQPCIDAIDAYCDEDIYREIEMPQGVSYRGMNTAPAHAIVEQHRLDSWLIEDEYFEDEEI